MTPILLSLLGTAGAQVPPRRAAVVVGANQGGGGLAPLRYAHDDALRVASALTTFGRFDPEAVTVLLDPTATEILGALGRVRASELVLFYYSGHAEGNALLPGPGRLYAAQLTAALDDVGAPIDLAVIDACRGGTWTGTKGSGPPAVEGTATLSASSGAEDAHESEAMGGSLFTHHWLAGLRGAADADRDRRVTLEESFRYAREQTVWSALAIGGAQHPSFHLDLRGRDPVVLSDLGRRGTGLTIAWREGVVTVHDVQHGTVVATMRSVGEPAEIALAPGRYVVRRQRPEGIDTAEIELVAGQPAWIDEADLEPLPGGGWRSKGLPGAAVSRLVPPAHHLLMGFHAPSETGFRPGPAIRDISSHVAVDFGVTDHVAVSLFPLLGLGVRLGSEEQGVEGAVHVGLSGLYALQGQLDPTLHVTLRSDVTDTVGWLVHLTARDDTPLPGTRQYRAPSELPLGLTPSRSPHVALAWGLTIEAGRRVQLNFGLGLGYGDFYLLDPTLPQYVFGFGGTLGVGQRALPLLRVLVSERLAIEASVQGLWTPGDGLLGGPSAGFTWAMPLQRSRR